MNAQRYTRQQIQQMNDAEVAAALAEDFLDRDGVTFVKTRSTGRLGWEQTLPKGSAYSQKMLSPANDEELAKAAYSHASDMVKAMNVPYRVQVCVSGKDSWTDSVTLHVASKCLDDRRLSIGQRLDVFTGLTVHEGSHLLYTDFKVPRGTDPLLHVLHNIIEDEMIERHLGEDKPGFSNFLTAAKYYTFGLYEEEIDKNTNSDEDTSVLLDVINAIISIVRYPKALTQEIISNEGRFLLEVRSALLPFPEDTAQSLKAAERVRDLLVERFKDKLEQKAGDNQNQQNQQGKQGQQSQQGQKNEPQSGQQPSGNDAQKSDEDKNRQSSSKNNSSSQDKTTGSDGKPSGGQDSATGSQNGMTDAQARSRVEKALKNLREAMEKISSNPGKRIRTDDKADVFKKKNGLIAAECEGVAQRGKSERTVLIMQPENKTRYMESLARVRRWIPALSNSLRGNGTEYRTALKGVRHGILDPSKIAEAYQGVQSVYMKDVKVKADSMAVTLLIDESGSMYGELIQAARDTAVLFNEALKNVGNITLNIFGYSSGDFGHELYRYLDAGARRRYALGSIDARGTTPTASAITEVADRMTALKEEKKLLIIVSDGCPDGGVANVGKIVDKTCKKGISVIGISIDDGLPEKTLKQMYGRYVKFSDMNSLVCDLSKLLKKEVLDSTKRRITA